MTIITVKIEVSDEHADNMLEHIKNLFNADVRLSAHEYARRKGITIISTTTTKSKKHKTKTNYWCRGCKKHINVSEITSDRTNLKHSRKFGGCGFIVEKQHGK